jgi:hypothetical protein
MVGVFLLSNCSKDFVELDNPNQASKETYFKNTTQLTEAVNAAYGGFHFIGLFARDYYFIFDLLGNEATAAPALQGSLNDFANYTLNGSTDYVQKLWRSLYRINLRATFALDRINAYTPANETETARINQLIGEAKFLRAWSYFHLVTLWGRVPLRKTMDDFNFSAGTFKRSPVADIYTFIIADLQDAVSKLPYRYGSPARTSDQTWSQADIGRATKGTATGLLGKVYLYQKDYAKAEVEFAKLDPDYDLYSNYYELFREVSDNSKEAVFEVQNDYKNDDVYYMWGNIESGGTYGSSAVHSGRSQEYGMADWKNVYFSDNLASSYTYNDESGTSYQDPRSALTFYSTAAKGGDNTWLDYSSSGPQSVNDLLNGGSWFKKYQNYEYQNSEGGPISGTNAREMRYADVLLMRAEALIQLTRYSDALPLINRVRIRVGAFPYTTLGTTTDNAMTILKRERRLELAGEQIRYFDLVRWGELVTEINAEKSAAGKGTPVQAKHILFPIPDEEKTSNSEVKNDIANNWN